MIYFVIGLGILLLMFVLYIIISLNIVNRLVNRICENTDKSDICKRNLQEAQEKLIVALRQADDDCTISPKLYVLSACALKALSSQIQFYLSAHPKALKNEAVYQHYLTYDRHLNAFNINETETEQMYAKFESYRKNALISGFAEGAFVKLPQKEDTKEGILGFGLMRLPMNKDGEVDVLQSMAMADCMLQRGYTYFDTAYFYLDGRSERVAKKILAERYPRECYRLADKMPIYHLKEQGDVARIFDEQLERTGTGYFDYYLLHALNNNTYEKQSKTFGVFEFIADKKAKGQVKNMGFSFHDKPEVLEKILNEHPEVDFVQLQLNYYDWESTDVQARRCYEVARAHGKQIVVMEPIKGGNLAYMPKDVAETIPQLLENDSPATLALRFIAGKEGIMTVLSGMSTLAQAIENAERMRELKALSESEEQALLSAAEMIRKIPVYACTRCKYCLEVCPVKLPIPGIVGAMNRRLRGEKAEILQAKDCIACGACEKVCPQKLPIRKIMTEGAKN